MGSIIKKGEFGYLKKKRILMIAVTSFLFLLSIGIIVMGYVTTGTRKNLLTIVGVLGLLPASKCLVTLIMLFLAKSCDQSLCDEITKLNGPYISLYDMFFTSYKKNFSILHLVIMNSVIICLCADDKFDPGSCREHLLTMLKNVGTEGVTVSFAKDRDEYLLMLKNLSEKNSDNVSSAKDASIKKLLFDISL
ncbi:MAG: hypothetical protein K6A38_03215 [Lachnospiraceae bacterium]|nr:hypothetical protein [Lachnospiraceae bacterium]